MTDVGIRALKQNASAVVAKVAAGEVITVTDRGRPVARMVPIRKSRLDELIDAGLATKATRSIQDLPLPMPTPAGSPTVSEVLDQMRSEERY